MPYALLALLFFSCATNEFEPGEKIDELHGVGVYYNGGLGKTYGRNLSGVG